MKTLLTIIGTAICACTVHPAPIQYIWTATGSGALGTTAFSDTHFTFTATADIDALEIDDVLPGIWRVLNTAVTLSVVGVGSATVDNTWTIAYGPQLPLELHQTYFEPLAGFSIDVPGLESYDGSTDFGPASGPAHFWHGTTNLLTSAGDFQLDSVSTGTFEAVVVPEPSFVLLGLASLIVAARGRGR